MPIFQVRAQLQSYHNVVIFYPDDTVNLFELMTQIDTVVTVGTVGIEGALLGKNVCFRHRPIFGIWVHPHLPFSRGFRP